MLYLVVKAKIIRRIDVVELKERRSPGAIDEVLERQNKKFLFHFANAGASMRPSPPASNRNNRCVALSMAQNSIKFRMTFFCWRSFRQPMLIKYLSSVLLAFARVRRYCAPSSLFLLCLTLIQSSGLYVHRSRRPIIHIYPVPATASAFIHGFA